MLADLPSAFQASPLACMAFNITSIEGFEVLVEIGEHYRIPLILQISERYLRELTPAFVSDLAIPRMDRSPNLFVLHLDHAGSMEAVMTGIRMGFTSVMYDGSQLNFRENVRLTREVLKMAHVARVSVEAEIGHVGGTEDGDEDIEEYLTTVEEARQFIDEAPVDALAVAVGNAHGLYTKPPELRIDLIAALHQAVNTPLVLHGGTGIPIPDIIQAAHAGVKKVNIGTELKQAWLIGAQDGVQQFHELDQVRRVIRQHVREAVLRFGPVMGLRNSN